MPKVLNKAAGPRVFHVKAGKGHDGKDVVEAVTLMPGQSAELDLADPDNAVLKAWCDSGEVLMGADADRHMRRASKGTEDRAERIASLRKELAELEAAEAAAARPQVQPHPQQPSQQPHPQASQQMREQQHQQRREEAKKG